MTAARPALGPVYEAVLLIRPEAWPAFSRWLPTSGLATTRVPVRDRVPRFELAPATTPTPVLPRKELSTREVDVLELIAEGLQNPEIAARLEVSVDTVKTHSKHIYRKFGAKSRAHAVHIAYQRGILGGS